MRRGGIGLCLAVVLALVAGQTWAREQLSVGWVSQAPHPFIADFRDGMKDFGWVEGDNLVIDERYAGEREAQLLTFARDLAKDGIDVIVTSGMSTTKAVARLDLGLPIIFVGDDPVRHGVARSLARPGGDVTGITLLFEDISSKWVELLEQLLPDLERFAVLAPRVSTNRGQLEQVEASARAFQLELMPLLVEQPEQVVPAIQQAAARKAEALVILSSPLFAASRQEIIEATARERLPTIYEHRDFTKHGGLISYGPDLGDVFRRLAGYVDRIANGARPGDLPIEQPTKLELVVNMRTAQELGITIPPAILLRADEVIE